MHSRKARAHIYCVSMCACFLCGRLIRREKESRRKSAREHIDKNSILFPLSSSFSSSSSVQIKPSSSKHGTTQNRIEQHNTSYVCVNEFIHCLWCRSASECIPCILYTAVYLVYLLCENDGKCATQQNSSIETQYCTEIHMCTTNIPLFSLF